MSPRPSHDLTRTTLTVLIICLLIAGSLWITLPFLGSIVWAASIVLATWPLLLRIQRFTGGRRSIAAAVMTCAVLALFILPLWLAAGMLLNAALKGLDFAQVYFANGLGSPPQWLENLPWLGERLAAAWQRLAAGGPEGLMEAVRPHLRSAAGWIVSITGGFGILLVNFLLTILIVAVLYVTGEKAANGVVLFARRIGDEQGEQAVRLAGQAVRGVVLGVVVTALVQSALAGLGMWASGVPHVGLLLAIMFVLGIAQLGPLPILIPAIIWLYWSGSIGWSIALLVWSLPVAALDNILRPLLIRRGVDLPLLLIIAGVIGGLIGFGVIGLFVGPVVLAVTYSLLQSWLRGARAGEQRA
jgi:predicted PurR-regulated permease PerM